MTYGFIGCGNMGGAIAKALSQSTKDIYVSDRSGKAAVLAEELGIRYADPKFIAENCDRIFLAVKPHMMKGVLLPLRELLAEKKPLLITMAAGLEIAQIEAFAGCELPVIRIMPNTPTAIGKGVIDFRAVLEAAAETSCAYLAIEQNSKQPYEDLRSSFSALQQIRNTMEGSQQFQGHQGVTEEVVLFRQHRPEGDQVAVVHQVDQRAGHFHGVTQVGGGIQTDLRQTVVAASQTVAVILRIIDHAVGQFGGQVFGQGGIAGQRTGKVHHDLAGEEHGVIGAVGPVIHLAVQSQHVVQGLPTGDGAVGVEGGLPLVEQSQHHTVEGGGHSLRDLGLGRNAAGEEERLSGNGGFRFGVGGLRQGDTAQGQGKQRGKQYGQQHFFHGGGLLSRTWRTRYVLILVLV